MKSIYSITIAIALTVSFGCISGNCKNLSSANISKVNVKKVCDVKKNGVKAVLAQAKLYNPIAVKHQVEFMRFGATASEYIRATSEAIKNNSSTANVKQKKKVVKMKLEYTAWRACTFSIRALQQENEANMHYKKAIPGDGYKY
ncbi:hypothetical protein MNB_ARC-1_75 [hydrothermal vent metagenome]|uniref:Lipoprotein n=1 Tax=hydrothermal vent metagenome TaxID=652676 RepID=A0A3B1E6K1_9ZZZZ